MGGSRRPDKVGCLLENWASAPRRLHKRRAMPALRGVCEGDSWPCVGAVPGAAADQAEKGVGQMGFEGGRGGGGASIKTPGRGAGDVALCRNSGTSAAPASPESVDTEKCAFCGVNPQKKTHRFGSAVCRRAGLMNCFGDGCRARIGIGQRENVFNAATRRRNAAGLG